MIVRLCQFHIIQAITRWGKAKPSKKKNQQKSLSAQYHNLNEEALQEMLVLFWQTQRCCTHQEWPQFKKAFTDGVNAISAKHGCNAPVINAYFEDNWWSEEWLGMRSYIMQSILYSYGI